MLNNEGNKIEFQDLSFYYEFLLYINIIEIIFPMEHNWFFVYFCKISVETISKFHLRFNTDTSEHLTSHLTKETFNHIES